MAAYVTPQPLWKRNLVGFLDGLLCLMAFAVLLRLVPGGVHHAPIVVTTPNGSITQYELIRLDGWRTPAFLIWIALYHFGLGRTGGTPFQRLFGMRRAA
jgi:hypothetical protein